MTPINNNSTLLYIHASKFHARIFCRQSSQCGCTISYIKCNFEEKCSTAGPWTRVCPSGTQKFVGESSAVCRVRHPARGECLSLSGSIGSVAHNYFQVCSQLHVASYQKGSINTFWIWIQKVLILITWMESASHEEVLNSMCQHHIWATKSYYQIPETFT